MLRFPVSPSKADDLRLRMLALNIAENDLVERFFCPSSGRPRKRQAQVGVCLRHEPSGLEVSCQKFTSQALNRFIVRRKLVGALEKRQDKALPEKEYRPAEVETTAQHMQRMFLRSFERDIVQPYPVPSQKLLGAGNLPPKLIGILGERRAGPAGSSPRRAKRALRAGDG